MMTMARRALATALFLAASLTTAFGQTGVPNFPQTLPANSFVGRLGIGPGPAQAIPFASFFGRLQPTATSPTGNPTGGSLLSTYSTLVMQAATSFPGNREFLAQIGMTSDIGYGATNGNGDKVGLYVGAVAGTGSSDIWAVNFLCELKSNLTHNINNNCNETDLDNHHANYLTLSPSVYGQINSGAGEYQSTAGSAVTGLTPSIPVSLAANVGGLIRLTVLSTSTLVTGFRTTVAGVLGATQANGVWTITVIDGTHIDLQGSNGAAMSAYLSGGTIIGPIWQYGFLAVNGSVNEAAFYDFTGAKVSFKIDGTHEIGLDASRSFFSKAPILLGNNSALAALEADNTTIANLLYLDNTNVAQLGGGLKVSISTGSNNTIAKLSNSSTTGSFLDLQNLSAGGDAAVRFYNAGATHGWTAGFNHTTNHFDILPEVNFLSGRNPALSIDESSNVTLSNTLIVGGTQSVGVGATVNAISTLASSSIVFYGYGYGTPASLSVLPATMVLRDNSTSHSGLIKVQAVNSTPAVVDSFSFNPGFQWWDAGHEQTDLDINGYTDGVFGSMAVLYSGCKAANNNVGNGPACASDQPSAWLPGSNDAWNLGASNRGWKNAFITGYVLITPRTVGTLPACNSGLKGARSFVTDANGPAYNTTVASGGTVNISVTCDGTNWRT